MLYQIYTEDCFCNKADIGKILLARGIGSFSISQRSGWWKGQPEKAIVLEILDEAGELANKVYAAAEDIRALGRQDLVYVAEIPLRVIKSVTV
jgi:hypothetical protein